MYLVFTPTAIYHPHPGAVYRKNQVRRKVDEGWPQWRKTPTAVEVGPNVQRETVVAFRVFAGELNQLPAIVGGKDEEMMYVSTISYMMHFISCFWESPAS